MFQIDKHKVLIDDSELPQLCAEFAARHSVLMKQVIAPELLTKILKLLPLAGIEEREDHSNDTFAKELCVDENALISQALRMLFDNPNIFRLIEQIAVCPTIENFFGRVYLMKPDAGHYDSWHDDTDGKRLIGMSLNLSEEIYSGGVFQIKKLGAELPLNEIANTGLGDAHIFRISESLQHRVTEVVGTKTKTAFAGWFHTN